MPQTAADLQKSVDDFTTEATAQIKAVGENAQKAYDELKDHLEGQNALSSKGLEDCLKTIGKLEGEIQGHEKKQGELITTLEDMHKQISRVAAGASAANDGTYVRVKSNIISLEDYHKTAHQARGGNVDSYLTQTKSDDEIAFEKNFFGNMASNANKGEMERLQSSLMQAKSLIVSDLTSMGFYVPNAIQGRIIDKQFETSPMLQHAEVTNLASGNTLEHIVDRDQFTFQLLDEVTSISDSDLNNLKMLKIEAYEAVTKVLVSRRTLQDAGLDVSAYVANKAGDRSGRGF